MVGWFFSLWKVLGSIQDPAVNISTCWKRWNQNCSWCWPISVWVFLLRGKCKTCGIKRFEWPTKTREVPYKYRIFTCTKLCTPYTTSVYTVRILQLPLLCIFILLLFLSIPYSVINPLALCQNILANVINLFPYGN